jgi:hypothetical protein
MLLVALKCGLEKERSRLLWLELVHNAGIFERDVQHEP